MSVKDRLIQFILRGKDELSPAARQSEEALSNLREEAEQLGQALDAAKDARNLAVGLQQTQRAAEQAERSLVQADLQVKELRDALTAAPGSEGLQQSLKEAEREARRLQRGLDNLRVGLTDQEKAARAAGIDTNNLADEEKRLATEVDNARQALDANNAQLKNAQREQAKAARAAAEHASSQERVGEMLSSGAKKAGAFVAAYLSVNAAIGLVQRGMSLLASGIRAVALDGSDKQQALAQLEATLASTGRQAEFTSQQLLDMADAFEASSMLTAEQVQSAQTRLLSYTDVAAKEFPRALQIIIDQQQRLGISVEQSAEIVGRALQSPSQAMAALGRQGFKLEDDQKRLLKQLEATGRTAEAQAIIMDMLTEAYGGSAAAARMNTAAGLWKRLTDRIGDFASRVANSGAFEFMQRKLMEVADSLDEMANDGRLDRLAQALSTAFIDAAERAEEFAKKLLDIDFNTLTDDATRWLDNFGEKLDTAGRWLTMITAPFRALLNVVTGGISAIGVAFTGLISASLAGMALVARAIPDAFGGQKIVAGLESARDTALSMMQLLASQVAQDGLDIAATWDSVASAAEVSADRQSRAAARAAEETRRSMQKTGDDIASFFRSNITTLEQALAAITFAETAADLAEIEKALADSKLTTEELGTAMEALAQKRGFVTVADDAKRTTTELEQLRKEQTRLKAEYESGRISLQQWQEGHNKAAEAIIKLESAAGAAGDAASNLGVDFSDLSSIMGAVRKAANEVDFNRLRQGIRKAYGDGELTAQQFAKAQAELNQRVAELKPAAEESTKAVKDQGDALEGTANRVRSVGDAAEEAGSGLDFFGAVLTAARTPLANMSEAALAAFDALQGIQNFDAQIDMESIEGLRAGLLKVKDEAGALQAELGMIGSRDYGLGIWMRETALRSREVQARFLEQRLELQKLMDGYESGSTSLASFVGAARSAQNNLDLLDSSDLSQLESAIASAEQRMQQLGESSRNTLASLQDELDKVRGNEDAIEKRRAAQRRRELEQQLGEARQGGDSQAVANLQQSLSLLRQIEAETAQQREQQANQQRAAQQQATAPAAAQQAEPTKVIRLETTRGRRVDVSVPAGSEDALLGILEDAGLRSL